MLYLTQEYRKSESEMRFSPERFYNILTSSKEMCEYLFSAKLFDLFRYKTFPLPASLSSSFDLNILGALAFNRFWAR